MMLSRGLKYVFLILFPVIFVIVTFAPEGLRLWLGPTFSIQGAAVLRWAAAGVFINALAMLPFGMLQSAGRPDVTAWLLLGELPVYGCSRKCRDSCPSKALR
jgi:O-antigen/teichoic acid export membrane protein